MPQGPSPGSPVLVCVPTYNERENLPLVVAALERSVPGAHLLIIDDKSPDGTAEVAQELGRSRPQLHLLRRPGKQGLGVAYRHGFAWALERGYQLIVHMDADLSHDPADVPRLLAAAEQSDVAIGSRYVPGGGTEGWPLRRKVLSRSANLYARTMLRLPVNDLTGGFQCWHADTLRAIRVTELTANGYVFMVEKTFLALRAGFKVVEVPIIFRERRLGTSKMGLGLAAEGLKQVLKWSVQRKQQVRPTGAAPSVGSMADSTASTAIRTSRADGAAQLAPKQS